MPTDMATEKRLRLSFDARNEANRRAVYIAAAMTGKSHNDVLNDLIEEHLARYVTLANKAIEDDPPPRKRREKDDS